MLSVPRRELLAGVAAFMAAGVAGSRAQIVTGLPWRPDEAFRPVSAAFGPWLFFTGSKSAMMEALVDRLIPPDPQTPGGRTPAAPSTSTVSLRVHTEAAAGFTSAVRSSRARRTRGRRARTIRRRNTARRSPRSTPTRDANKGDAFAKTRRGHSGSASRGSREGRGQARRPRRRLFFKTLLKDTQEGFFADPLYGGNRDMCGWKMIGFPGARYDYRDWVGRHNERYPHPPVSIVGRADWTPTKS